ncbi:MAG TPA: hemolysin III family protein [Bauldia sp.]|nr:hemolysin III family protein [Bauldia sp.]
MTATAAVRPITPAEFAADRLVHLAGFSLALVAGAAVLARAIAAGGGGRVAAAAIYAFGLVAVFGFSAAYNLAVGNRHRELLRRLDHSSIFVLIAGTYTPFTVLGLAGGWAVGMTLLVWVIAPIGVGVKMLAPQRRYEGLSIALYVAFGWIGLIAIVPLLDRLSPGVLILIGAGGLLYSVGVVFHAWARLRFQRAIWHVFVLAAAALHYAAVWQVVVGTA